MKPQFLKAKEGPIAGVVTGAALLVDYVLTIAISVAAGVDALFSLLPVGVHHYKLAAGLAFVVAGVEDPGALLPGLGDRVGDGRPGPVTRLLLDAYRRRINGGAG